jgi:pyridoxine 5'-phosphate synthase PdxJ
MYYLENLYKYNNAVSEQVKRRGSDVLAGHGLEEKNVTIFHPCSMIVNYENKEKCNVIYINISLCL